MNDEQVDLGFDWTKAAEHLIKYVPEFAPILVARADGSWLETESGDRILDFASGQICSTLGHRHPRIVAAMREALDEFIHLDSKMLSAPVIELARRLAESLPGDLSRSLLLNTGAEANEVALKIAKMYTDRFEVVGVARAFHGVVSGTASYTFLPARKGYGPLLPGAAAVPAPYSYRCPIRHCEQMCDMACLESGFEHVDLTSVGSLAAMIVEPVLSSGGVIVPPDGYLKRVKELCDDRDMLLIADESQTGLGRLGTTYGVDHDDVVPDLMVLSKTLGGGVPLASTTTTNEIADTVEGRGFSHVTSHENDPLPAAAGIAVMDVIDQENLVANSAAMGEYLLTELKKFEDEFGCIGEVRGRGLLVGVEFVWDRKTREPAIGFAAEVYRRSLSRGVSVHAIPTGRRAHCFRIAPPLTITRDEIDFAVDVLRTAIRDAWAEHHG
jgi:2,2-dialkylglycine decarboxylase (pyruvate)